MEHILNKRHILVSTTFTLLPPDLVGQNINSKQHVVLRRCTPKGVLSKRYEVYEL